VANQKKIKIKKMQSQRHIDEFGELDGGGGYFGKIIIYKDANQTTNFIGVKTKNSIYYRGEKHY